MKSKLLILPSLLFISSCFIPLLISEKSSTSFSKFTNPLDDKIDIATLISDTNRNMGVFNEKPSLAAVLSFIYTKLPDQNKDCINDLEEGISTETYTIVKVKAYTTTYKGELTISYTINQKITVPAELKTDIGGNFQDTPTAAMILKRLDEENPSLVESQVLDINQLTVEMGEIQLDSLALSKYKVKIHPIQNSWKYTDPTASIEVKFTLRQHTVTFKGLTIKFPWDYCNESEETTVVSTDPTGVITFKRAGDYFITSNSDNTDKKCIVIEDGSSGSLKQVTLNVIGDEVKLDAPDTYSAIKVGEYCDLNFNVNAKTTLFQGAQNKTGVKLPYTSSITIEGSSMLTCKGGDAKNGTVGGTGDPDGKPGCAIGGEPVDTGTSSTDSDAACGFVHFKGNISADLKTGTNNTDHQANGGAVIGGAGAKKGYAGSCKGVEIDTTGQIYCYKNNNTSQWLYGQGSIVGGGGAGNVVGKYGNGGDLENFIMKNGTIILDKPANDKTINNCTPLGGGSVAVDQTTTQIPSKGGDLNNFDMSGGKIVINCPKEYGEYTGNTANNYRSEATTTIGGGCILLTRDSKNQTTTTGSLQNFKMTGGSICMYGDYCDRSDGIVIGPGTFCYEKGKSLGNTMTPGTSNIKIDGGSILITKTANGTTYHFDETGNNGNNVPKNSNNEKVYPVYIPTSLGTSDSTVSIPSIGYNAVLDDWSSYSGFAEYTGVIWLPIDNYTNILIGNTAYKCNVTDSYDVGGNVVSAS